MKILLFTLFGFFLVLPGGCCSVAKENNPVKKDAPNIKLKFVYNFANDISAQRDFYGNVIGLKEISYRNDKEYGWLSYNAGDVELQFWRKDGTALPVRGDWDWQPGRGEGNAFVSSWSLEIPEEDYAVTVGRILSSGCRTMTPKPEWLIDSYWGITVKDPMGNTVEVYCVPKIAPATKVWK